MGKYTITFQFDLSDAQEKLIDDILKEASQYNYIKGDVLEFILHSKFYYDFEDEKRTTYDDLLQLIIDEINEFETSLMYGKEEI